MTASTTSPVAAPAGRRRFWLTVAAFAIANALAWVGYHQYHASRTSGLLRVERFSHVDGGTVSTTPPRLAWTFNLDVAPPPGGQVPGTITPAVPGKWSWRNPRTLEFALSDPLPKATRFTLSIPAGRLATPGGFRLDEPFVSTIQTAPLALAGVRQFGFEDERAILELTFDDAVLPADVMRHLSLTGPDGKPLACELHGEAEATVLRVRTAPVPPALTDAPDRVVRVALSPGLAGRSGPLGMTEATEVPVTVEARLVATNVTATSDGRGGTGIHVDFNNAVEVATIREVVSVEPAVPFGVTGSDEGGVELAGDFAPGTRYAVKIAGPPVGVGAARAKFPKPATLSVFVPDHVPGVWFEHEAGYLGSRGNRTLLAQAVNAFELTVRVTRLYDNNLVEWRNSAGRQRWRGSSADEDYAAPVAEQTIRLPRNKNEKQDVRIALDDLLPAGAARDGAYRVRLTASAATTGGAGDAVDYGDRYAPSASTVVTLSDLALTAKTGRNEATAWVTSLAGGKPLAGVRVRVFSDKNQPLGNALSGDDGLARIALAATADGERPAVVIADRTGGGPGNGGASHDLTWLDLRDAGPTHARADTGGRPYLREGYEAFVYADRGVYRPGETVHLHAIVRGPDDATPQPFPVLFQLVRPDLRNWRAHATSLDADGAAGFELALPTDLPTGKWTAKVGLPGSSSAGTGGTEAKWFGTVSFQVEEFMPDRMKVELSLGGKAGASRLSPGTDPLRADVQADYLFGRPVAGRPATLVARVEPAAFEPNGWAGWTFHDAADTGAPLGVAAPLGRRAEMPVSDLDRAGQAGWDLDVRGLIEGGGDPIDPAAAANAGPDVAAGNATYFGPWTLTTTASVTEEGGRAVSATRKVELDLVRYYVGLRKPEGLVRPRTSQAFPIALVAPSGKATAADDAVFAATLYRESWNNSLVQENGRYRYESTRVLDAVGDDAATVTLTADGRGTCTVTPPAGGSYVLRVSDEQTGAVASVAFYAGDNSWDDQISREDPERLEVVLLPPGGSDAYLDAARRLDLPALGRLVRASITTGGPASGTIAADTDGAGRAYSVGERPRVLVRSPFKGRMLITVETDTVVWSRVIDMPASQVTVPIEVAETFRPNAYVTATVIRPVDPDAKWRAHRAAGVARLRVDHADRRLNVAIAALPEIRPRTTLDAAVRVTDAAGRPVPGAAVTVAAVDEGVLRLTDFKTPDPFAFFTGVRALATATADLYGQLLPEVPRLDKTAAPGGDGDAEDGRYRSPVAAKRVKPVALFSGVLHTDDNGRARASFQVPQFAGQLRLMAVAHHRGIPGASATPATPAVDATRSASSDPATPTSDAAPTALAEVVNGGAATGADTPERSAERRSVPSVVGSGLGSGELNVTVRSPLLVQSSWPRFAAPGDRFTVPVVVFNSGTGEGDVEVRLEIEPGFAGTPATLKFADGDAARATRTVRVAPAGQASAAFDVAALDRVGAARVRLVATLGGETFEETVELPVRPASPALTRGGYATAIPEKVTTVSLPQDPLPGTGERRLNVTPWPSLELPQGLEYLDRYPYGCAEQTVSGLLPLVYLGDVGARVAPHLFDRERIADKVRVGVVRLLGMRTADGGVGMWAGDRTTWPWASVYAAHFAVEARAAGHDIPDDFYDGLLAYARQMLGRPGDRADTLEAQAYACYVLALAGKPERAAMSRLGEVLSSAAGESDAVPAHARFHLAAGWLAAGRRDLAAALVPDALPAPRAGRQHAGNVGSPIRDQALVLATLAAVQPDRPDLPALAQSLADAGRAGRWRSTQDTAFAVLALGRYLKGAGEGKPYAGVELWQSGVRLASADAGEPIAWDGGPAAASASAAAPMEVRVTGPAGARAHVSWVHTGVGATPAPDADHAIKVRRRYLDARGRPVRDGAVRSGDLVKVELSVESPTALENLVIEDLLPAGLEIENPRLVTAAPAPAADDGDEGPAARVAVGATPPARPAFDVRRLDLRDDRLILAGDLTAAGTATYVYTARAVAPGTFVVPPVRGECMYDIGTSSVSGGGGTLRVTRAGTTGLADANDE